MRQVLFVLLLCLLLSACATPFTKNYKNEALTSTDVSYISAEIVNYVTTRLPPASSTIFLQTSAPEGQSKKADESEESLAIVVGTELRNRGFAIAELNTNSTKAHRVRYSAATLGVGVILQVTVDDVIASRWYVRNAAGGLEPESVYTVRYPK